MENSYFESMYNRVKREKMKNKVLGYVIATPFVIVLFGVLVLYSAWSGGYVSSVLYQWFITPYFNVPQFTLWQFVGFSLFLVALLPSHQIAKDIKKEYLDEDTNWVRPLTIILRPWMLLLIAYFIKWYIG